MPDLKISQMASGGRIAAGDIFPAVRAGANIKVSAGGGAVGLQLYNAATTAIAQNILALGSASTVQFNSMTLATLNGTSTFVMRTGTTGGNQLNIDVRNTSAAAYDRVLACSAGASPAADLGRFVTLGGETIVKVSAQGTAARALLSTPGTI